MAETTEPIIKLEEGGQASVISYNVPEPTSYTGRNFIELALEKSDFLPVALEVPEEETGDTGSSGGGFHLGDLHGQLQPRESDSIAGMGPPPSPPRGEGKQIKPLRRAAIAREQRPRGRRIPRPG